MGYGDLPQLFQAPLSGLGLEIASLLAAEYPVLPRFMLADGRNSDRCFVVDTEFLSYFHKVFQFGETGSLKLV